MREPSLSRRQLLLSAAITGVGSTMPLWADEPSSKEGDEPFPKNGAEALQRLKAGNARFADGKTRYTHQSADWRKHLVGGQKPIATLLGCSDSRVPPELVFDQGFGSIFVIRVAGNVVAPEVIGSIAYAALHLRTPLFVVMGHESCGAVTAALDAKLKQAKEPETIETILKLIEPGLKDIDEKLEPAKLLDAAIEANVRWSMKQLAAVPGAKTALEKGGGMLVGAVYDLETGKVRFLKD
jgi:carbonic anhydrase